MTLLLSRTSRLGILPIKDRAREVESLKERDEYAGQWIALDGEKLIASGDDLKQQVVSPARQLGVPDALRMRVEPNDALPFVGFWTAPGLGAEPVVEQPLAQHKPLSPVLDRQT